MLSERENTDSRAHILYDSISMTSWKRQNCRARNKINGCQWLEWRRVLTTGGHEETFRKGWKCSIFNLWLTQLYTLFKTHWTVHRKRVTYTLYNLYLFRNIALVWWQRRFLIKIPRNWEDFHPQSFEQSTTWFCTKVPNPFIPLLWGRINEGVKCFWEIPPPEDKRSRGKAVSSTITPPPLCV